MAREAIDPDWMDLANMRQNGPRHIDLYCGCGRQAQVNVDHLPDETKVPAVRLHYRCSECGAHPMISRPGWTARLAIRPEA